MILDIITLIILVLCAVRGAGKGFIYTFLHTLGWIGALVAAFFFTRPLSSLLSGSFIGDLVREALMGKFEGSRFAVENAIEGLPDVIRGGILAGTEEASEFMAGLFATLVISIISFALIFFAVLFILRIFIKPASKRHGGGLLNTSDRVLGLVAGLIKGVLIIFIMTAMLLLLINITWTGLSEILVDMLRNSVVTETFYNNNFLLLVTGGLFS